MEINKALDKLFSLHTFGIKLGLDNIKIFLELLGNPQEKLKIFHIAGSNGKGSTTSFLASILIEHNFKTGIYTSPHFVRFNERIKIGTEEIPDEYTAQFISKYEPYIDEHKLTFFEVTTALAFQYFAEMKVDYAIIETGLGGRLDATNVVNSLASIITSISLEHTNILGNSIELITNEKSDIIRPNSYAVIGLIDDVAVKLISEKCRTKGTDLFVLSNYYDIINKILIFKDILIDFNKISLPLKGEHQINNASIAIIAAKTVLPDLETSKIISGLDNVISNTNFSGRYEYFHNVPDIILDSAHNPEGIKSFINEFKKDFKKYESTNLLFTALKDKNVKEMLSILKPYFDNVYLVELEIERAMSLEKLMEIGSELSMRFFPLDDAKEFVKNFIGNKENSCLVILGSMYLLGKIKAN